MVYKGLAITSAVPESEKNPEMFFYALDAIGKCDLQLLEIYAYEKENASEYGKASKERGYKTVFLTGIDQKRSGWCRICAEDEGIRVKSLDFTKKSLEKAFAAQAFRAVILSGDFPKQPVMEGVCLEAFARSLEELHAFVGKDMDLGIEICDRSVAGCQLIGSSLEAYTFVKNLNVNGVVLTMDTAHVMLSYEDPFEAVKLCKPVSDHVHFSNCCNIKGHPLFGDKHPLFGEEGSQLSDAKAQELYKCILETYADKDLYLTAEMLGTVPDQRAFLHRFIDSMPWFFGPALS